MCFEQKWMLQDVKKQGQPGCCKSFLLLANIHQVLRTPSEKNSSALAFTEFLEVNKILNDNWDCNGGWRDLYYHKAYDRKSKLVWEIWRVREHRDRLVWMRGIWNIGLCQTGESLKRLGEFFFSKCISHCGAWSYHMFFTKEMAYCQVGPRRIHIMAAFKRGLAREGVETREPVRETRR